jgi:hypothetical protein
MNFSGMPDNKAFTTGIGAAEPYYYISAHLDLTGLHTGAITETDPYIFYFNRHNDFSYLNRALYPSPDDYPGFYYIGENEVIGEVTVFTNPSVVYEFPEDLEFLVGGAYKPSIALDESLSPGDRLISQSLDIWGGPSGNIPDNITLEQLEHGQICYYGKEPQNPNPNPENDADLEFGSRRYLALKFAPLTGGADRKLPSPKTIRPRPRVVPYSTGLIGENGRAAAGLRPRQFARQVRVVAEPTIEAGKFHVVVKVYPKAVY